MSNETPEKSSRMSTGGYLLIAVGVIALLFSCAMLAYSSLRNDRPSRTVSPTRSATQIRTLQLGSGRGDEVSDDFDVPAGCARQTLTYEGERIDNDIDVAFVNFRVHDTQGNPADSAIGPADLLDASSGSGLWTLDTGTYVIEITGANAEWSYKLQCR